VTAANGFDMPLQARSRTFATDLSASFPVAGSAAVVIASPDLLKKSPEEWVIIAEHEMFHVFQAANGSEQKIAALDIASRNEAASWQLKFPFPYGDKNVMRLIQLQGYPLWLAANSSAWHTHPLGQILIVTDGEGWIRQWGGPVQVIRKGDVVWISPGVKHWHGATPTTAMTHIAVQENLNGVAVNWLEQVTNEQYQLSK
jgi:mannose-6-phosphate isomerase-like protein (cupin superfamily)